MTVEFSQDIQERMKRGIRCGSDSARSMQGWLSIIEETNERLRELDPDYTIDQIKEKFGALRYYASFDMELDIGEQFWRITDIAEAESTRICMTCGSTDDTVTTRANKNSYWLLTLCDGCRNE